LKTRFGAEAFIWQEIGLQIRKVYEILVHPADQRLHLIRKTVKDTIILVSFCCFWIKLRALMIDFLDFLLKIARYGQFARIFWQIGHKE